MPQDNYTHIAFLLDRSGSMGMLVPETIEGVNAFLAEQRKVPGVATMELVLFDDQYQSLGRRPLSDYPDLTVQTYQPAGSTSLHDAMHRLISETFEFCDSLAPENRPGRTVIVILTDGEENTSRQFAYDQVAQQIVAAKDRGWEVLFLGANQDAIASGAKLGVSQGTSMTWRYDSTSYTATLNSVSANLASYRVGAIRSMAFTVDQRTSANADQSGS